MRKKLFAVIMTAVMTVSLAACGSSSSANASADSSGAPSIAEAEPEYDVSAAYEDVWKPDPDESEPEGVRIAASDVRIGLICAGGDDSVYAAAHVDGLANACANLGIDWESQADIRKNVPEDASCYDNAVDLAKKGCNIIFSTSCDHQKYMQQAATEYPKVTFVSCAGNRAAMYALENFKNMYPCAFESRYVSGIVAGLKLAEMISADPSLDPHVGYVGAYPYPEVISGMTAFFLGVRTVVPVAHMDVKYTNAWSDPAAETSAAEKLMSNGCSIISYHTDSVSVPTAVQAAHEGGRNVYCVGYDTDVRGVAPDAALTSAQNNWAVLYEYMLNALMLGKSIPVDYTANAESGAVMISELGGACAEGTQSMVDTTWEAIREGSLQVFDTSSFTCQPSADGSYTVDENGVVTSAFGLDEDGDLINDSGEAIVDGAFMESVLRSAPYFALRVEGITEIF